MKFTPSEARILVHRLEVSDAIADVMADEGIATAEQVEEVCASLLRGYSDGDPLEADMDDPLVRAIIIDCCDGSTYFADMEDEVGYSITRGQFLSARKAAKTLSEKVGTEVTTD